jgi:hypothetical protein
MQLPSFLRREENAIARRERTQLIERRVTASLRSLGALFTRLADGIEKRRLSRAGYEEQERYLTRTDKPK